MTTLRAFSSLSDDSTILDLVEQLGRAHGAEAREQGFEGESQDVDAPAWDAVNALLAQHEIDRVDGYSAEGRPVVRAYLRGFNADA